MWLIQYLIHNNPTNSFRGLPLLPVPILPLKNLPEAHLQILRHPDHLLHQIPCLSYTDLYRIRNPPANYKLLP